MSSGQDSLHFYWATGCTSCLRTKEFLERNGVEFNSHNIIEDPSGFEDLATLGLPEQVPLIRRGSEWAFAVDLNEVAEVANITHAAEILPVNELYARLESFLAITAEFLIHIPESELTTHIPNRPRSYADLLFHIYSIPDAFISHDLGLGLSYPNQPSWNHESTIALQTYATLVMERLSDWYTGPGESLDWTERVQTHFGNPTKHEFFERTTWHAGQHTRQIEWVLKPVLEKPEIPEINDQLFEGLPMPSRVWANQD